MTASEYVDRYMQGHNGDLPEVTDLNCYFEGCKNPVGVAVWESHDYDNYMCTEHALEVLEAVKARVAATPTMDSGT